MVWSNSSPDKSVGMWISVVHINSYVWHISEQLLSHVESSRSSSDNGESVLLTILNFVLVLNVFGKLRVVFAGGIEREVASTCDRVRHESAVCG